MNFDRSIFLVNDHARAMLCDYVGEDGTRTPKGARHVFKTLDPSLKAGDIVIVPTETRHKFTCVKIQKADVDVDFEGTEEIHWIVGPVDIDEYEQRLKDEEVVIEKVRAADLHRRREQLKNDLLGARAADLKALPLVSMNGDPSPKTE